jgi:hypothetical protein
MGTLRSELDLTPGKSHVNKSPAEKDAAVRSTPSSYPEVTDIPSLLALQSHAGNEAVTAILQRKAAGGPAPNVKAAGEKEGNEPSITANTKPEFVLALSNTAKHYVRILREQREGVELLGKDVAAGNSSVAAEILKICVMAALVAATDGIGELVVAGLYEESAEVGARVMTELTKSMVAHTLEGFVDKGIDYVKEHRLSSIEAFVHVQVNALSETADSLEDSFDLLKSKEYLAAFDKNPAKAVADLNKFRDALTAQQKVASQVQYTESLRQWWVYQARHQMGTFKPESGSEKPGTDLSKATGMRGSGGMLDVIKVVAKAASSPTAPLQIEWVEMDSDIALTGPLKAKPLSQLGIPYSVLFFVPGYGSDWYSAFVSRNEGGSMFISTDPPYGRPFLVRWLSQRWAAPAGGQTSSGGSPGVAEMHHEMFAPGISEGHAFRAARVLAEEEIGSRSIDQLNRRK